MERSTHWASTGVVGYGGILSSMSNDDLQLRSGGHLTRMVVKANGRVGVGTDAPELMEIVAGAARVRLDGSSEWKEYGAGTSFRVPGKSGFDIAVASGIAEYVCSFE